MIQKTLVTFIALLSLQTLASGGSAQNMLWQFTPSAMAGDRTKAYCATNKVAPYTPKLCLGEITRTDFREPVEGYIQYQKSENSPQETLKIVRAFGWKFLYRQTQYVANADVFERTIEVVDSKGRRSVLNETFDYFANYDDYDKMRTRKLEGSLPDGSPVSLTNIYFFY